MAATTDYNTSVTRDQYITRACRLCGLIDDRGSISAEMLDNGKAMLADLIEAWHNEGLNLNTHRETIYAMPTASSVTGTDGNVYTCIKNHTADATANKPITGTDWRYYWRQDDTATGSTWLTGTAYTAPNEFALPTGLMYVKDAFIRDSNHFDTLLNIVNEDEYLAIADKFTSGRPSRLWIVERPWNAKTAYLWPATPDSTTLELHINGVYLMGGLTNGTSEADMPSTARLALLYDLASLMADLYQRPQIAQQFVARAVALKRNFFRVYRESHNTIVQVASRFPKLRRRRY